MDATTETVQRGWWWGMKRLTMNPNNKRYYSIEYIKGWEDGVKAQYEARLQGEWIVLDGKVVCSECNEPHYEN